MNDDQVKNLNEVLTKLKLGGSQFLIVPGYLTGLRHSTTELDPTKVDRDEYKRVIGVPSLFAVKMGGSENTDQITAALGFPFNEWITQTNFPLMPSETPTEDEIEIIDPGCSFGEKEGLKFLADAKLDRPNYEHCIRFAQQQGMTTTSKKKPFIIFLHEAWPDPNHDRRFMCMNRDPDRRRIYLLSPDNGFFDLCVLAGVRRRKQPQS